MGEKNHTGHRAASDSTRKKEKDPSLSSSLPEIERRNRSANDPNQEHLRRAESEKRQKTRGEGITLVLGTSINP